jgi:aprataxin
MNHLHIHVLSVDHVSECLKAAGHYNSFTTGFFVPLDAFPLAEDDPRRAKRGLGENLICWRCGSDFKRKFVELKGHLEEEFEMWKRE